jgi:hypothetical protein
MRSILFLCLFFTTVAFGSEDSDSWRNNILLKQTVFDQSPSDSVFTRSEGKDPVPVQRIRVLISKDPSRQAHELLAKIWTSLGYNQGGQNPEETPLRETFGPSKSLPGRIYQRKITQGKDRFIYCVGMFKTRSAMYAIYFKTFEDITKSCSPDLLSLSESKVLYQ